MGLGWESIAGAAFPTQAIGTIIAGGLEFGGDYLNNKAAQDEASKNREYQDRVNERNYQIQKEFAQMGIQWKVADAIKAGIHPLAALGASTQGASPSFQMSDSGPSNKRPFASALNRMGQDITRSYMATATPEERALKALQLESISLDNEYKRRTMPFMGPMPLQTGPGIPGPTTDTHLAGSRTDIFKANGLDPRVQDNPLQRIVSDPRDSSKEAGAIPDYQIVRTSNGYSVVPGRDVKQAIEDSLMEWQWLARAATRKYKLPDGRMAIMNPITGELITKQDIMRGITGHPTYRDFLKSFRFWRKEE